MGPARSLPEVEEQAADTAVEVLAGNTRPLVDAADAGVGATAAAGAVVAVAVAGAVAGRPA